jgi:hypothetical protein
MLIDLSLSKWYYTFVNMTNLRLSSGKWGWRTYICHFDEVKFFNVGPKADNHPSFDLGSGELRNDAWCLVNGQETYPQVVRRVVRLWHRQEEVLEWKVGWQNHAICNALIHCDCFLQRSYSSCFWYPLCSLVSYVIYEADYINYINYCTIYLSNCMPRSQPQVFFVSSAKM